MVKFFKSIEAVKSSLFHFIKKVKFVCFLLLFIIPSFSQNYIHGKIEYLIKNNDDFNPNKIINSEKIKEIDINYKNKLINSMMKTSLFTLLFNNEASLYELKEDKMIIEDDKTLNINFLELYGEGKSKFYTNLKERKTIVQEKSIILDDELFLIENIFFEWQLTQETKKISSFTCYKAIKKEKNNKKTIAWYTTELPFSFGPKIYNNLPGLILELHSGNFIFLATKIEITKDKNLKIDKPNQGKKIKNEDYNKLIEKTMQKNGF